jgi:exodeoxyribonuclease VII large subunit
MTTDIPLPEGIKVCTVSELTRDVKALVEEAFASVWVEGEIVDITRHRSGHIYLTLKDADAKLRAVIWRTTAQWLDFEPQDGLAVIVRGRISVYPPRGDYQLMIDVLHPKGIGAHDLALRQLKAKLERLGYFAAERKKPLPRFPIRIALVTSPTGAAVRDMLEILGRRWPIARVLVVPVKVQGEGASESISSGLRVANRFKADVILLGRGGGSSEDLAAFNTEAVAQAVFESRIPVVSAVGHEIDVTLADLVADRRALTPSEAAELVTPDRQKLLDGLTSVEKRLRDLLLRQWKSAEDRLGDIVARRPFRLPLDRVRDFERRLDETEERLRRGILRKRDGLCHQADALAARLAALSPLNVLARGYSLTRKECDKSVVRSPDQVQPGDRLVTLLEKGEIVSRVEDPSHAKPPSEPGAACLEIEIVEKRSVSKKAPRLQPGGFPLFTSLDGEE